MKKTRVKVPFVEEDDFIREVIFNLDFCKIRKVMKVIDWKWTRNDGVSEVPSIADMLKTITDLFRHVQKEKSDDRVYCASGGFIVVRDYTLEFGSKKREYYYRVEFVLDEFEYEIKGK